MRVEPCVCLALCLATAGRPQEFRAETVTIEGGEFDGRSFAYRVHVPADVAEDEKLPVLLFLHGAGERGDDNRRQLAHLPERMLRADHRERFRGIVVAPQCARGAMWITVDWSKRESTSATSDSPWLDVAMAALDRTLETEPCDPDRVYLTGLSMGGFGAWHLAARAPERFAGVVAVCGGGDPSIAPRLRELPIWAWHGAADRTVPPERSRAIVAAVRAAGGTAHYTELPGVGHASWHQAYALDGALGWLWTLRRSLPYTGRVVAVEPGTEADGSARVVVRQSRPDADAEEDVVWEWRGEGLPAEQRAWLTDPTDARQVELGASVLVTAGKGGVFWVRVPDGAVLFAAKVDGEPRSATLLPDRSIVVAARESNRLTRLHTDATRGVATAPFELPGARGVHWDAGGELLWALGATELVALTIDEHGQFAERRRVPLGRVEAEGLEPVVRDLTAMARAGPRVWP